MNTFVDKAGTSA